MTLQSNHLMFFSTAYTQHGHKVKFFAPRFGRSDGAKPQK